MTKPVLLARFRFTVVLSVCLATVVTARAETQSTRGGGQPPVATDAVAVLPFQSISATPADDWLGRGIAETVTADLDRLGTLAVVGPEAVFERAAAMGDGGTADDVSLRIGRALGVRWVVSGGFQRAGDRIRVTARVIDVVSGDVAPIQLPPRRRVRPVGLPISGSSPAAPSCGRGAPMHHP